MVSLTLLPVDRLGNQLQVGDLVTVVTHSLPKFRNKNGFIFRIDPPRFGGQYCSVYVDIGEVILDEPNEDWDDEDRDEFELNPQDFALTYGWDVLPAHTGISASTRDVELIGPVDIIGDNDDDCI